MRDQIVFYVNGVRHAIRDDLALESLAEWLREERRWVGTKIVCNEGDCGACSVLVGRPNSSGGPLVYQTLDSCIAFPFQLDKTHIVTVEGLKEGKTLSPVQEAMVRCHGSQCGFCTPGFVVTLHGVAESESGWDDPSIRYELSGNLCRCTGYLSILQAAQSINPSKIARLRDRFPEPTMLEDFAELGDAPVQLATSRGTILIPKTLKQALEFRQAFPKAALVSGATDYGVLRNHGKLAAGDTISLSSIGDFAEIAIRDGTLTIGGGATWRAIERFTRQCLPEYHAILTRFGSPQIRNAGTLAGNIANGSPIADSLPLHYVTQTEIELQSLRGTRRVPIEDFYLGYRKTSIAQDEIIAAIHTPLPKVNERIKLYKISRRRDMDISTVTVGIWLCLDDDIVQSARIALGGVGPMVIRMREAEAALAGQLVSETSFRRAGRIAREAISPWTDVRGGADYRRQLVENLFVKCFHELRHPVSR